MPFNTSNANELRRAVRWMLAVVSLSAYSTDVLSAQENQIKPKAKGAADNRPSMSTESNPTPAFDVAPGFMVTEIPYGGGPLVWIDADNLLFVGARADRRSELGRPGASDEIALYRWTASSGKVVELMKAGNYANLCYDRGYLHLSFDRGENRVIREGPIGHEREVVVKRGTGASPKGFFNPYNCRFREIPPATQSDRGVVTVLRDDHGFIEGERPLERFPQRRYFLVQPSGERIQISKMEAVFRVETSSVWCASLV